MAAEKRFMKGTLFLLACFLMLSAVCSAQESGPVTTPVNPDSVEVRSQQHGRFKASSNALEEARIIGVDSDIARLSKSTTAENSNNGAGLPVQDVPQARRQDREPHSHFVRADRSQNL